MAVTDQLTQHTTNRHTQDITEPCYNQPSDMSDGWVLMSAWFQHVMSWAVGCLGSEVALGHPGGPGLRVISTASRQHQPRE